ncbi:DMT family transporter [Rhodohalobacter mucosus]|uniref:EamA family transporter n=1 Tax=Rhodohalobacter mucosus TaxID=2079485 RepID=A0A316TPY2_9BACT|nr:EamA family transporter [Rhodohalobacter mucosus]PWN06450.1 EamA family transporter [Rhodohalobacter mucosus]
MRQTNALPTVMVGGAAALWGCIGIFTEYLSDGGFTSLQIVTLRAAMAAILLFFILWLRDPSLLRIRLADYRYFIGTGILSVTFFNWCYFTAINVTSLSVAVILLYTGPAFVILLSALLFREKITPRKAVSLALTFAGVVLVTGVFPAGFSEFSFYGILVGLGSGFGYALYSIFSKFALEKFRPLTIIFYTFLFASLFLIPFTLIVGPEWPSQTFTPESFGVVLGMGIFPTVLAYLLYTEGLNRMEAGSASITAMIEPATAATLGIMLFGEQIRILQVMGILLVLFSVSALYVNVGSKEKRTRA